MLFGGIAKFNSLYEGNFSWLFSLYLEKLKITLSGSCVVSQILLI